MARYHPALLGGLFIGVLSALPIIGAANCCCLWVILGGMLAVYLEQQNTPQPIETSAAALSGLIAGALGGMINSLATLVQMRFVGGMQQEAIDDALANIPNMPPETLEMIRSLTSGASMGLIMFVITVPLFAVFGMLGALLGVAFFRKKGTPDGTVGPVS
jgi:hypothetical protein